MSFNVTRAEESIEEIIVSRNVVQQMQDAQLDCLTYGFQDYNQTRLVSLLENILVNALTLLVHLSVPETIALDIAGILGFSDFGPTEEHYLNNGVYILQEIKNWMDSNTRFDLIKVQITYIYFYDDNDNSRISFIQGYDNLPYKITAVHSGSGWQSPAA